MASTVWREKPIAIALLTLLLLLVAVPEGAIQGPVRVALFVWLFAVILACAFRVIFHAGELGNRFGEPYGTLVLTFSILAIEVSLIASVMLTGEPDPTLARATMFAGLMLSMNGVVGVVLLVGGLQYGQQEFNLEGARAYLAALIPLAVIALVLPNFTTGKSGVLSTPQATGIGVAIVLFYLIFLAVQTMRHRSFFVDVHHGDLGDHGSGSQVPASATSNLWHFAVLFAALILIAMLARDLGIIVDHGLHRLGMPTAVGGILIAVLTLTPESVSAVRAALADRLQHSVNVFLGGAVATIGLTVPCVLIISLATNQPVVLGLKDSDMVLLLLTLFVSILTFGGVKTNVLQGAVHLLLFFLYILLIFAP